MKLAEMDPKSPAWLSLGLRLARMALKARQKRVIAMKRGNERVSDEVNLAKQQDPRP